MKTMRCGAGGKDELPRTRISPLLFPALKNRSNLLRSLSNDKSKVTHTAAILLDHGIALLRWVGALGEEHAFVSSGFFVFAHAAGLF